MVDTFRSFCHLASVGTKAEPGTLMLVLALVVAAKLLELPSANGGTKQRPQEMVDKLTV